MRPFLGRVVRFSGSALSIFSVPVLLLAAVTLLPTAPPAAAAGREHLKPGTVLNLTVAKYQRPWSLFVPPNYSPRVSWPLVISSHGLHGTGKGEIRAWVPLARKYGFIVACPDMCSATEGRPPHTNLSKWDEDDAVIVAIFKEISTNFRVNHRAVMITGFSGGGNPSYYSGLRHPEIFTHICTRSGNFASFQIPTDPKVLAAGKKHLHIYIFYGDHDHPFILGTPDKPGQAIQAHKALLAAGYEHVKFEEIAGGKHQSRPGRAAKWFGDYLEKNRRLFADGDKADKILDRAHEELAKKRYREAIRSLDKLGKFETKHGLEPRAAGEKAKIEKIGEKMLEDAKKAHDGGDTGGALRILRRLVDDFRGLPCEKKAQSLEKEWKS